ncbi:MAG: multicopper oxidase domain-containing protein, partial [Propionibacteriaceae bacterium]|nr:multicopper oxidase domain-containing protein [Propionibacteriaceae bacterium]
EIGRRTFLALSGGALTLFAVGGTGHPRALAAMPAPDVIPATTISKFAQPLVVPGIMPRVRRIGNRGNPIDFYEIAVRQFDQQMLGPGLPQTTVWGYGSVGGQGRGHQEFHSPSLSIQTEVGVLVRIRWHNQLVDAAGNYRPHLLAVDPTLHWANPPREPGHDGISSTDIQPAFAGRRYVRPEAYTDPATQYTDYTGPVPMVPHLHGAKGLGSESDGYSEAWFLPAARNIPAGHARHGRWWDHLKDRAERSFGARWGDGYVEYQYPNDNRAGTLWFHDHALGLTRLNVYAGPIGFYLLSGQADRAQVPSPSGQLRPATFPRDIPSGAYDLPLAIQDRSFNADGSLFYPDSREWFDPDYVDGPWYPQEPGINPVWVPEFFGNTLIVNGRVWPYHEVEARRYTLRLLNGCNARTLYLDFNSIPGVKVHQVGNDGGLLAEVIDVMAQEGWRRGRLVMAPSERVELVVDFSTVPRGRHILRNVGPDGFFGGGIPGIDFPVADPATTGNVLAFDVRNARGTDQSSDPTTIVMPGIPRYPEPVRTRRLATTMHFSHLSTPERPLDPPFLGAKTMMGVLHGEPGGPVHIQELMWGDPVTENPGLGETEDWVIYNLIQEVGVPHPIHIHEVPFEILERGRFSYDTSASGAYTEGVLHHTEPMPLLPGESGLKDTTFVYPGEFVRVRMKFDKPGTFMWHCHLLEHEDNEMMRPYRVGPVQPGEPPPLGGHAGHHS